MKNIHTADFTTLVNQGCVLFKEGEYELALQKFKDSLKISEFNAELYYNIALCLYESWEYEEVLKFVDEIILKAYK